MPARAISARERRTIAWGGAIATLALFVAFVAAPVARRWISREAAIDAARERVARMRGLADASSQLLAAASAPSPSASQGRVLRARTGALAGASLQSLLQDLARSSRVSVNRLEVAADSGGAGDPSVTAALSATTDIYGLADFLTRIQGSPVVLVTADVSVAMNPVLRGNLLQLAVSVRAPLLLEP